MRKTLPIIIGLVGTLFSNIGSAATFHVDKTTSSITVKAKATGGGFTGTLSDYQATIKGDPSTLKPSSVKVTWKFSDLDTKEAKRNKKMLTWLETGTHPSGEFTLSKTFEKTVLGKKQTYAVGTIKVHGISKQIVFPISITKKGKSVTITGQAGLKTTDFNLPIIRIALIATVKPNIVINFSLKGEIK